VGGRALIRQGKPRSRPWRSSSSRGCPQLCPESKISRPSPDMVSRGLVAVAHVLLSAINGSGRHERGKSDRSDHFGSAESKANSLTKATDWRAAYSYFRRASRTPKNMQFPLATIGSKFGRGTPCDDDERPCGSTGGKGPGPRENALPNVKLAEYV